MKKTAIILLLLATVLTATSCKRNLKDLITTDASSAGATEPTSSPSTEEPDPFDALGDDDLINGSIYVYDDYSPFMTIGDLDAAFNVKRADADAEVNNSLYEIFASFLGQKFTPAEEGETLAKGDQAVIFYTGYPVDSSVKLADETLAGMTNKTSETGHKIVIGSGSFITAYESTEHPENNNPGFEEQLIGMKAGESRKIKVTFPDVYKNDTTLQGVPVYFDVELVSFGHPDDPKGLTDEMIEEYTDGDYKTISEITEYLYDYYRAEIACSQLFGSITVENYPEKELQEYIDNFLKYNKTDDSTDEEIEEMKKEGEKQGKQNIAEKLIGNYLYQKYDIKLTKKQYYDYIQENYDAYATYYMYYFGITSVDQMEDHFGREYLIYEFKYRHLLDYLDEKAVLLTE